MTAAGSWVAEVSVGPLWLWVLVPLVWLALCAAAAAPVAHRMGNRSPAALVVPAIVGVVAVFVASGWLKVRLDFVTGLLLSLIVAAGAAAVQALVIRLALPPIGRAPGMRRRETADPAEVRDSHW